MKYLQILIILLFTSLNSNAQYDIGVTGITNPASGTSVNGGQTTTLVFDVENLGSNNIPTGLQDTIWFDIVTGGSVQQSFYWFPSSTFTAGTTIPLQVTIDFGNYSLSNGNFTLCMQSRWSRDFVTSNNSTCQTNTYGSQSGVDVGINPGSVVIAAPTGYPANSNIPLFTLLDTLRLSIKNYGTQTVAQGTSLPISLEIGSGAPIPLTGTAYQSIAPGASLSFNIPCTPGGIDENFPTSNGAFQICIETTLSSDVNSNNDQSCTSWIMGSGGGTVYDVGVVDVEILNPSGFPAGSSVPLGTSLNRVTVTFENFGTTSIPSGTSIPCFFQISGGAQQNFTFNLPATLSAGGTVSYNLNTSNSSTGILADFPTSAGNFNICVESNLTGDPTTSNNRRCRSWAMSSGGSLTHLVTGFSPSSGPVGTEVTIEGIRFSSMLTNNIVRFGSASTVVATVKSGSDSTLVVDVPAGTSTGPIQVIIGADTVTTAQLFTISSNPGPIINDFNPKLAVEGATVTIDGDNFDPTDANNTVTFTGGSIGNILSATKRKIRVEIPVGTQNGPITVATGSGSDVSDEDLILTTDPIITDFTPDAGIALTSVTINGFNFSDIAANNTVLFGAFSTTPAVATETRLIVAAPATLVPGFYWLTVTINGNSTTSNTQFNVMLLGLDDLDETSLGKLHYSNEGLNISYSNEVGAKQVELKVFSLDGKLIASEKLDSKGGQHLMNLNLAKANYVAFLVFDGQNKVGKKFYAE